MKSIIHTIKNNSLLLTIMLLGLLSCFAIWNAVPLAITNSNPARLPFVQLGFYIVGIIMALVIYKIGMDSLYHHIKILYAVLMVLLFLLAFDHFMYTRIIHRHIVPFALYVNGATCWYNLKVFSFQPSEFMKIILIMYLAQMSANFALKHPENDLETEISYIIEVAKLSLPPMILILLENDQGMMLVLAIGVFFIMFSSFLRKQWFILIAALALSVIALMSWLFVYHNNIFTLFVRGHTLDRFYGWLNPEGTAAREGLQLWFAQLSYGTAGWFGHGLQAKVMNVPEAQTDFIFAVIATDFGFFGSLITILLILLFDMLLLSIGLKSAHIRDKIFAMGIIGMLVFQQLWNISMVLGLLPITGITLPLISYGGSSLLSYLIAMGVFLDMNYQNQISRGLFNYVGEKEFSLGVLR